ncbi:tape measure protein [Chryseobacterium sp. SN22]|uniref:tape measure protein n=1 Tax=Chryseobacterium sp. SN22 TaxID=2606431 RepID=UPI0011EC60EE|nr:tape measure protein [Chryseobacterium sp. SN22]KAA0126442.1 tape measure protein [Chryseobacterium sp. SN22]
MNTSQGALYFGAGIDLNQFNRDLASMRAGIAGLTQTAAIETRSIDGYFKNLSVGIAGYFSVGALKSFAMELINVRGEFQKTEIAFSTMLGSADKAKALMGQMVDLAAKTPFGLDEVSAGAKQLLAFQVPANEVVDVLTRMGNIAAGLGVPLSRINLVYGQVKAKGKLMGDDLRQFTEAGIPMVAELAKKFNKTTGEITNMVSAGKIGFKDVQDVLFSMTNEGGMFFNLMEKQSASLSGKIANLGDSWDQMLNKIGESNEGVIYGGIEALNYLVENYKDVLDIIETLIVLYGSYKAAVIVTSAAQTFANKTIQSEIALLSISEKMKLGRAMVTQRQAEATAREAAAEVVSTQEKYRALQIEVSSLAAKKQTLRQSGLNALAKLQEAKVQLSLAQLELSSMQAVGSAREIEIAQKRVLTAQNAVIAAQETATIAKNASVANSIAFRTQKQLLENTARAIGTAQGTAAVAAEAAQTAAKNANAIATTRLTLVTTFRTAATQLATQAQALLNATMLNNPIVIVIAAVAALTYAYFKLRDTSTALTIAEKILNDERERSTKSIEELRSKTQELTSVISSDTSTKLQQIEAYKSLTDIYPAILKNMDLETFKKLSSTEAQKKLNAEIDKYSTQNLRDQVARAKSNIEDITKRIDALNERLKKRDGDAGIYLSQLENAKKNLEAQQIVLSKYNGELDERLHNEKLASMSLIEQKKYWEQQIDAISRQISAQEKSNKKKSEALDKLSNINSMVKTTSLEFINWNITPLLSQLNKAQQEINKINNAQSGNDVTKNKAFWEEQKKQASEANDAMSGKQIGSAAWNENIKKIREATEQLKKYDYSDRDLLKAQKERDRERKRLEKGAEKSFIEGSIKRYDQQINLLEEAKARSDGKSVRLRYVDKYGKERYSAEVISVEEANKRIVKLNEERAAREKAIRAYSFEEQITESERQWNNYYKMAEFYGKQSADAQYKDLFKGSQSYLDYLEKQAQALKDLSDQGILSDKQKQDLVLLQAKIRELDGTETPLENFKRGLDNALKSMPSLVDQLDYLNTKEFELDKKGPNTSLSLESRKAIEENRKAIIQQQKDTYQEFITEQRSFEEKKLSIEQKYNDIRKKIGEDQTLTDEQRFKKLAQTTKKENEEIGSASLESIKKTDLWVKAFGDLERTGPKTLVKLKKGLEDYLKTTEGKGLLPTEMKEVQDQIKKLNDLINSNNPYKAIGVAVDVYRKKREELNAVEAKSGKSSDAYGIKLEETKQAFVGIVDASGNAAKATLETIGSMSDAFGGMTDELKQTLNDVEQLTAGVINAVAGYYSGNTGQMISGIISAIGAVVKLTNGDSERERKIKQWSNAIEDLKYQYSELQKAIEKTAGESQLKMQEKLIDNLREQQKILADIRSKEAQKKKADQDKIASYTRQIEEINSAVQKIIDDFRTSITTVEVEDLASNIGDAIIDAFSKGEDAANSFDKVVDDVMRNAVANALKMKFLQPAVEKMVDQLYSSMGFGNTGGATPEQINTLKTYEQAIANINEKLKTASPISASSLESQKKYYQELIAQLKSQISTAEITGSFDGLTEEERKKIKELGTTAMQQYTDALEQYKDLFGESAETAQGLKGDIKGITEKTGGALEGQFNAVRINIGEVLKIMQGNKILDNAKINLLTQIEVNTRRLHNIDKNMQELNSKVKYGAAGIP